METKKWRNNDIAGCPEHPRSRVRVRDGRCKTCIEIERRIQSKIGRPRVRKSSMETDGERARLTRLIFDLDEQLERAATPWEREELRVKRNDARVQLARVTFHTGDFM